MPLEVREADRQCRKAETQEVDCLVAFVGLLHLWAGVAGLNEPGILPPVSTFRAQTGDGNYARSGNWAL